MASYLSAVWLRVRRSEYDRRFCSSVISRVGAETPAKAEVAVPLMRVVSATENEILGFILPVGVAHPR